MLKFRLCAPAALSLCVALAACNSSGGTPSATPTPAPQSANISGDYTGTITDSAGGTGTATAVLAQAGSNAGGAVVDKEASQTITPAISLAVASSNSVSGAMVVDYANGTTCTFGATGTYSNNGTIATLSGSYTAVTNCAGQTGTFSLTQQCTDTVTASERRAMSYPAAC